MGKEQKQENNQTVIINMPQPTPQEIPQIPPKVPPNAKKKPSKRCIQIIVAIIGALGVIIAAIIPVLITIHRGNTKEIPLSLAGWSPWGDITTIQQDNTVTLDGEVNMAGYFTITMDMSMRGKTIILVLENTEVSDFSNNCLIKITVNTTDDLVKPEGINTLALNEYVPYGNNRITFPLPANFNGKLGFVFTRAKLNNLKITAFYRG